MQKQPQIVPADPTPTAPTLGELIGSTLALIILIATGLFTLTLCLWAMTKNLPEPLRITILILTISVLAGAAIGTWRMLRYERAERSFRTEESRRREREDAAHALAAGINAAGTPVRITQADIDEAVLRLIAAYYNAGTYTRASMDNMSQSLWNAANDALKAARLRRGRAAKLHADDQALAWAAYLSWRHSSRSATVDAEGNLIRR